MEKARTQEREADREVKRVSFMRHFYGLSEVLLNTSEKAEALLIAEVD